MTTRPEHAPGGAPTRARGWTAFRGVLLFAGVWLTGYAVYRYTLFAPPDHGTVYGKIFLLAPLLAWTGIALALRPDLLRGGGATRGAARVALSSYGLVWMGTGLHCTASLLEGMAAAPLGGSIDMIHMLSDHVVLPASVVALAWAPDRVARRLGAASANAGAQDLVAASPGTPGRADAEARA